MKSKKPILPRWWYAEIDFMQSVGFRVVVGIIALAIVGYGGFRVSDWISYKRKHNRLLRLDEQSSKSYRSVLPSPSTPSLTEVTPANSAAEIGTPDKEKPAEQPTAQWDWAGDTEIAGSVEPKVDDESLSDADLDELEIEVLTEDSVALRKQSDEARAKAEEMLSHAMPLLVEQLNNMSTDQQRAFLSELRSTMLDYFPPELKTVAVNNPDLKVAERGWESFMSQLRAHGFKPSD